MVGEAGIEPTIPGLEGPSGPFPLVTINCPSHFRQRVFPLIYSHFAVRVPQKSPAVIGHFIGKPRESRKTVVK